MHDSDTVKVSRTDYKEILEILRTTKRYVELNPNNGGKDGVIGQIEELLARLPK